MTVRAAIALIESPEERPIEEAALGTNEKVSSFESEYAVEHVEPNVSEGG